MQSRFSKITLELQRGLPSWFKMRKSPNTVGAKFLNVFGLQFEDIEYYLNHAFKNMYIDSVDLNQADIIYKATLPSSLTPDDRYSFNADGLRMDEVQTLNKFLNGISADHLSHKEVFYQNPVFIDWVRKVVYVKEAYDTNPDYLEGRIELVLKDMMDKTTLRTWLPTQVHHVWNFFDEFGLLLDTPRLYGERNVEYKERLLDVFRHPANSTFQGLQNHLARELGLYKDVRWYDGGIDLVLANSNIVVNSLSVDGKEWPRDKMWIDRSQRWVLKGDPAYEGQTRIVKFVSGLEMHTFHNRRDTAFQAELYSIDRVGTPMLQYYVDLITNQVPVMWDQFIWNESFWDIADKEMSGYGYIPSFHDARFLNWSKYKS
ncbi:hypothetical protein ACK8P5_25570 (plasmid) [Paenibacillus sp. EC2-1]|uniref:hypothetical protein n=1 Tax=Paenibacillus sp. EC2-1 TaxID=3388665 RepID=UPI003BEEFE85